MKILRVAGVLFLCAAVSGLGHTNQSVIFRVSSPSNTVINLDFIQPSLGFLSCPNSAVGVTNQIQRAYRLDGESNWVDYVQLESTSMTPIILNPPDDDGMVFIPSGILQMGDSFGESTSDERPVHSVCAGGIFMGKHEVTNDEMVQVMQKKGNP